MSFQVNDFTNSAKWQPYIVGAGTVANRTASSFQTVLTTTSGETAGLISSVQNLSTFDLSVKATAVASKVTLEVNLNSTRQEATDVYVLGMVRDKSYGILCKLSGGFVGTPMADPVAAGTQAEMRIVKTGTTITWYYNGTQIQTAEAPAWLVLTSAYVYVVSDNTRTGGGTVDAGTDTFTSVGGVSNWTLTITAGTGGSVSPTTASGVAGTVTPSITATPDATHQFAGWLLDGVAPTNPMQNPTSFLINDTNAHVLHANFTEIIVDEWNISVVVSPAGAGTVTPMSASGTVGTGSGTFTESPSSGYRFDHWVYDGTNYTQQPSIAFTPTIGAHTLTAIFVPNTYQHTINSTPINVNFDLT